MDFDQIEIERKFSINAKVASVTWNKNLLNIIDTPGYTNFLHETKCALSAVDGAVIIASAITGVKAETIRVWQYAEEYNLSKLIFINKMDKERADFYNALGDPVEMKVKGYHLSLRKDEASKIEVEMI